MEEFKIKYQASHEITDTINENFGNIYSKYLMEFNHKKVPIKSMIDWSINGY